MESQKKSEADDNVTMSRQDAPHSNHYPSADKAKRPPSVADRSDLRNIATEPSPKGKAVNASDGGGKHRSCNRQVERAQLINRYNIQQYEDGKDESSNECGVDADEEDDESDMPRSSHALSDK